MNESTNSSNSVINPSPDLTPDSPTGNSINAETQKAMNCSIPYPNKCNTLVAE